MNLVIFDVCNTIVNTNSTYSYIDFLISKWVKTSYKILFHNRIFQFLINWFSFLFKKNYQIVLIQKYFRWLNVKQTQTISIPFFKWYEKQIFPHMKNIINTEKKLWSHMILLSASINPPIDYLSEKLWIRSYSSKLEEEKWIYTWKVSPLRWKKERIFINNHIKLSEFSTIELYTDNIDDVWLIKYLKRNSLWLYVHILPYENKRYWEKFFKLYDIKHDMMD